MMKLYFGKGACSVAPHILLEAAGLPYETVSVDLRSKALPDGGSLLSVNPKGQVPTFINEKGQLLTECAVILQYIADQVPEKNLLPKFGTWERYQANEWLNYIATEIHKGLGFFFAVDRLISNKEGNAEIRKSWVEGLSKKFDLIAKHLSERPFFLGSKFSAVDAYAFAVLSWHGFLQVDLSKWPEITKYLDRVRAEPAAQRALKAEGLM